MHPFGRMLAFLLLGCLCGCRSSAPEPILIGHLAPTSGPDKVIGEHAKQAILLAVEEVNKEDDRLLGRRVAVLHPAYPPDDLDKLQPVAVRLITVDKVVALLGGIDMDQAKSLGRAAQPYDAPLVTPAQLPPELLGDNVFSVNVGLAFHGQVLAKFAAKELHASRVAVWVDGRRAATVALASVFAREFSKGRSAETQEWSYKNPSDLSELIQRLKRYQPQAILHAGSVVDLGRLRAKLHESGLKLAVLVGGDQEHLSALQADQDASNGVYAATPFVPGEGPVQSQEFTKKYSEKFQQAPDLHAALAYDGVRALVEALRRAKSFERPEDVARLRGKLREELAKSEESPFDSVSGPFSFDKNHTARRPLYVVQLEGGALKRPVLYPAEGK